MGGRSVARSASGRVAAALGLALAGLAGCGGGERGEAAAVWMPSEAAPAGRSAGAGGGRPPPARAGQGHPFAAGAITLEGIGEIELARGSVQRVYRVRFHNGPRAQTGVVAQLVSTGSGATVVDGRVVVGDLAPGAVVTPADTITLRHPGELAIDAAALRWKLTETGHDGGSAGTLLRGRPEESAVAALRDYLLPVPTLGTAAVGSTLVAAPGLRLSAVIERDATVEQVNSALRSASARIARMRPGNRTILLAVSDPGRREALQGLAQRLQDSAAFESVSLPPPAGAADGGAALEAPADPEPNFNDHRDI